MKTNLKNRLLRTPLLGKSLSSTAAASLLALSSAHAVNIWDGGAGGGDGNWNTPANWDDNAIPTAGVLLTFAGDVQPSTTNDLAAVIPTFLGINFTNDGSAGKTAGFTLAGAGINPGNANIVTTTIIEGGTPITDTISLPLTLTNNKTFITGLGHNLIISGTVLNGSASRQIIKNGEGELILANAANTYAGATSINGGILTINAAGAGIADAGVTSALGAATTATTGTPAIANSTIKIAGGALNFTLGAASTNRQVRVGGTGPSTAGAAITNNSANGSTPLVFTNPNFSDITTTGGVNVARTLTLGGANTDANAIVGIIANSDTAAGGTVAVTKEGIGNWILSGDNTYTGTTTITAGTLRIDKPYLANSSAVVMSATGKLNLNFDETGGDVTDTVDTLTINGTQLDAGVYGATGSGAPLANINDTNFAGVGTLTVTTSPAPSNPYTTWSGGAAFDADANNDGVKNGLAWMLGAANPTENALSLLPTATVSAGTLTLSQFDRVNPTGTAKLFVEYSTDLTIWTPTETLTANGVTTTGAVTITIAGGPAPAPQTVDVTISAAAAPGGKLFARLKATEN